MTSRLCSCLPLFAALVSLAPVSAHAARVVFVNTEPVTIVGGATNDPAADTVNVNNFMDTDFDGWAGASDEQKAELLALLKDTSVAFDIEFVLERPAEGPYDMVVFGSADDHASSFGGNCSTAVGLSDCSDQNGVSLAFAYWGCLDEADQLDPERVAFSALTALGFGWGLEGLGGNGQVMAQWSNNALEWGTTCTNLSGAGNCPHLECDAGQQNSTADLLANLGARVDDGPPVITVIEPTPGSDVEEPFNVRVEIDDAFGGVEAALSIVDLDVPPVIDDAYPYEWANLAIGAGPTTLQVTATDADGNSVSTEIPVCVGGGCPDDDPETGGESETSGGEEESSGSGETGGSAGAEAGGADGGEGGGCSVGGQAGRDFIPFGLLALVGLLALRRRG